MRKMENIGESRDKPLERARKVLEKMIKSRKVRKERKNDKKQIYCSI